MECNGQNCWAHLRWFCEHAGVVLVFDGPSKYYVDPYCYALPFYVVERFQQLDELGRKGLIEFVGVHPAMRLCQYRAIRKVCHEEGWGGLSTRVKNGKPRTVEVCKLRKQETNSSSPSLQ